jgi:hypothetical protein
LYDYEQIKIVEGHIEKYFGKASTVLHEFASVGVHIDVEIVEPTEDKNFFTLITVGMGTYRMNVPPEYNEEQIDRAELLICLPPDWEIKSTETKDRWPSDLLRFLARLPLEENSWLGFGHTVPNGEPYAENTKLSSCVLLGVQEAPPEAEVCTLSNGERIVFYQVIPLYNEEMEYKLKHGTDAMLENMGDVDHIVDIGRSSAFSQ